MAMLIAQISDMHIKPPGELLYKRVDTAGFLERAVAHVNALDPRPDIVIATGDLVDGGKPEEYALLKRLLAPLAMPVHLIALDTLVPGKGYGALCAERLDWLEARLGESDRLTVLFMHHPPFDCGIDAFDGMRLNEGGERLA